MGGSVSVENAVIISIAQDGSIGLTEGFAKTYADVMPAPFNLRQPVVTRDDEVLIKANWAAICRGTSAYDRVKYLTPDKFFYITFYQALFVNDMSLRAMFRSSMTVQGKSLAGVMGTLASIIVGDNFVETVQAIARTHLKYGVARDHYTLFGNVLIAALETVSGDAWTPEVGAAYLRAYSLIYYVMMPILSTGTPTPMKESLKAMIIRSDAISTTAKYIRLEFDFLLRYHPGDSVWLGLPLPHGEERRHFTIASVSLEGSRSVDICVQDIGVATHWLCNQEVGTFVNLYWVETEVRLEIDTPEMLPKHVVLAGFGIGVIPMLIMYKGLCHIRDTFPRESVAVLQCAPSPDVVAPFHDAIAKQAVGWDASNVHFAPSMAPETLQAVAPHVQDAHVFVCGPDEFVTATKAAYAAVGGKNSVTELSFDNNRPFPLGSASLSAILLAMLTTKNE
ncbi:Aste57867_23403 [Aphanomyces stellatus]|uniref:nitric oxide dioxygenase n=1 Tax=Aphanomyces stellatus TaxID=120398 RepID=A0A485LS66_9STRA|nr:hypothetical protein As57867_023332 [Aphanomyces stellatus]VFU00049.1 Aste57867_23403 [Aphanomyces stellatus]